MPTPDPIDNESIDSPRALLDALRDHPEWTDSQRAQIFDRLIAEHEPEALLDAIQGRLNNLCGHDGEAVLRVAEAFATPELLDSLAQALTNQPELPAEREW